MKPKTIEDLFMQIQIDADNGVVYNQELYYNECERIINELLAEHKRRILEANKPALPTNKCIEDWWRGSNDNKHFWEHEDTWSNKEVVNQIKTALRYFITVWQ